MFSPVEMDLERGWPGKIDGESVFQLAAQTLQAFFTGGGTAREHAEYPLAEVRFRAPVLHPPSVRVFDEQEAFWFANPAAIIGPDATVPALGPLEAHVRLAAVIGAEGAVGGYTGLAEIRSRDVPPPKDRDFALVLGPVVVTIDEAPPSGFDWEAAVPFAARNTRLDPGDILAGPAERVETVSSALDVVVEGIGPLTNPVAP
jgi:hypothetical protein